MSSEPDPVDLVMQATAAFPRRPSWDEYFMATAALIASRSSCERLHVGCVLVTGGDRKNRIVAAGYNGFLPGTPHTSRVRDGHEQATVHAEQNAVIHAARFDMIGSTLYLAGVSADTGALVKGAQPCRICKRMIINAGIARVVVQTAPGRCKVFLVRDWVKNNLGDFKKVRGRLEPVMPRGY